jgi:hypothetical protein
MKRGGELAVGRAAGIVEAGAERGMGLWGQSLETAANGAAKAGIGTRIGRDARFRHPLEALEIERREQPEAARLVERQVAEEAEPVAERGVIRRARVGASTTCGETFRNTASTSSAGAKEQAGAKRDLREAEPGRKGILIALNGGEGPVEVGLDRTGDPPARRLVWRQSSS